MCVTAIPAIQTSECDPDRRGGGVSLSLSLSHYTLTSSVSLSEISTDRRDTFLTTKTPGQGELQCFLTDKCVIAVEVKGADSPSDWFEMGRWMDGQMKEGRKRNMPLG